MRWALGLITVSGLGACTAAPPWREVDCDLTALCDDDGCRVVIDLPIVEVAGTLTYDGAPLPTSDREVATLSFVDPDTGWLVQRVSLSGGAQRWQVSLPTGVYDLVFNLSQGADDVARPTDAEVLVAQAVPVDRGTVLDLDVPIITVSGIVESDVLMDRIQVLWRGSRLRSFDLTPATDGAYELFVPAGAGELWVSGITAEGRSVYTWHPQASFESAIDHRVDLTLDVIEITGSIAVDRPTDPQLNELFVGPAGQPSRRSIVPISEGEFAFLMTPGTVDIGAWITQPHTAFGLFETGLKLDSDQRLDIRTTAVPIRLPEGNEAISARVVMTSDAPIARSDAVPTSAINSPMWAFPGTYRAVASVGLPIAPGEILLGESVRVSDETVLPAFPDQVSLQGRWQPVEHPGVVERDDPALRLQSTDPTAPFARPMAFENNSYAFDAFIGTYEAWATATVSTDTNINLTAHQQLTADNPLNTDAVLDIDLAWRDVELDLRVNGEPTTNPAFDGVLTWTHHRRPELTSGMVVVGGQQPAAPITAGVYDLSFAWAHQYAYPLRSCVVLD